MGLAVCLAMYPIGLDWLLIFEGWTSIYSSVLSQALWQMDPLMEELSEMFGSPD